MVVDLCFLGAIKAGIPSLIQEIMLSLLCVLAIKFETRGYSSIYKRGEGTFYDVGLGSCGFTNSNGEMVAALAVADMGEQSNGNPNCGRTICVNGKVEVKAVDKCMGCVAGDVDLSPTAFAAAVGDAGIGRAPASWVWGSCSGGSPAPAKQEAPAPKVEEVKAEAKVEAPKQEEAKVEAPKQTEAKVEQPTVETPAPEQPKVEEAKVEQPKVEEVKIEQPKVEEVKVEQPKEEAKVEQPKEEVKVETPAPEHKEEKHYEQNTNDHSSTPIQEQPVEVKAAEQPVQKPAVLEQIVPVIEQTTAARVQPTPTIVQPLSVAEEAEATATETGNEFDEELEDSDNYHSEKKGLIKRSADYLASFLN